MCVPMDGGQHSCGRELGEHRTMMGILVTRDVLTWKRCWVRAGCCFCGAGWDWECRRDWSGSGEEEQWNGAVEPNLQILFELQGAVGLAGQ